MNEYPPAALRERAAEKIVEVDAKIAQLRAIRAELARAVAARCDSLTDCTCADCPLPFTDCGGDPA